MPLTRPRFEQINSIVTTISDPITVLNQGSTLANIDVGFIFNRDGGTNSNIALFWDESANSFVTAFTTSTGSNNANITISDYANLRINTLNATLVNTTGNIISAGNVTASYYFGNGSQLSGVITSVTKIISGTSDITAYENSNIAVSVNGTANTVVFTSSNILVSGSIIPTANVSYDLGSPTNKFRSAYFSGNTVYIGEESVSVASNGTWTFTSAGASVNLGANAEFNPPSANISGNITARYFYGNGSQLSGISTDSFKTITANASSIVASGADTLTISGQNGINVIANANTKTLTIAGTPGQQGLTVDYGLVTEAIAYSIDYGTI